MTSLKPTYHCSLHAILCITAKFSRSRGWPLYTGLTVYHFIPIPCFVCSQNSQNSKFWEFMFWYPLFLFPIILWMCAISKKIIKKCLAILFRVSMNVRTSCRWMIYQYLIGILRIKGKNISYSTYIRDGKHKPINLVLHYATQKQVIVQK
jgi:hypothetical protein